MGVHNFPAGLGSRQIFKRLRLRLRLLVFFQAAPGPGPAPAPRSQKHPAPAPDYWLSLAKYSFPRKLVR